jgi:hypothetical protein
VFKAFTLSANIPKDLLVACIKAGVINSALGLVMARQKPDPKDGTECLSRQYLTTSLQNLMSA